MLIVSHHLFYSKLGRVLIFIARHMKYEELPAALFIVRFFTDWKSHLDLQNNDNQAPVNLPNACARVPEAIEFLIAALIAFTDPAGLVI